MMTPIVSDVPHDTGVIGNSQPPAANTLEPDNSKEKTAYESPPIDDEDYVIENDSTDGQVAMAVYPDSNEQANCTVPVAPTNDILSPPLPLDDKDESNLSSEEAIQITPTPDLGWTREPAEGARQISKWDRYASTFTEEERLGRSSVQKTLKSCALPARLEAYLDSGAVKNANGENVAYAEITDN